MAIGNLICYLPILPKSTPIINSIRLDNKGVRSAFFYTLSLLLSFSFFFFPQLPTLFPPGKERGLHFVDGVAHQPMPNQTLQQKAET